MSESEPEVAGGLAREPGLGTEVDGEPAEGGEAEVAGEPGVDGEAEVAEEPGSGSEAEVDGEPGVDGEPSVDGELARDAYPVVLTAGDDPSGLADLLHQYLSQTLADSPEKVERARDLSGEVGFQAAEDEAISVKLVFHGDRIELVDGELIEAPRLTGDFLSVAHLTSGEESPLALVLSRKLRVRFGVRHVPFLMGVLDLMTLEEELQRRRARLRLAAAGVAVAGTAGAIAYYLAMQP